ncbi:MAG: tetratricopeptide repeat protein [Bacteroidaceae bacterium]|nr:tetratricopeptide repeat protein [Bacteroidaceae bacterium]
MRLLERAAKAERSPLRRAKIFHNMGLILQSQKQYGPAIQSYMESLRNNPHDNETRYNLVLCQRQLKNNPDNQDKKDDKKDDKDKREQDKQQQQKQNQPKQDEEKQDNTQQQKPKQNEMNKENAEQMLNAALQNERRTQDKVKQQQIRGGQRRLKKQW